MVIGWVIEYVSYGYMMNYPPAGAFRMPLMSIRTGSIMGSGGGSPTLQKKQQEIMGNNDVGNTNEVSIHEE